LGSLLLDGPLSLTGSTYSATNAAVEIGFSPTSTESYTPLSIWTGDMSFTSNGTSFTFNGTIQGIAESSDISIADIATEQTFSMASLTGTGVSISGGSSIGVLGASLTPNSIVLTDPAGGDTTNSFVSLQGPLGFSELPGLSVSVSGTNYVQISPSATAPGLTLVAATTTSAFQAFGVDFTPSSVSVGYSTNSDNFQFSGSVGVVTSSGDFSVSGSLGTTSSPGLLIDSTGFVTQLSVTLSSNITTYGLSIDADSLTLNYQTSSSDEYTIESGSISASTSSGDFSFLGAFGSGTQPGLVIDNGSLSSLYATLNGTATASGLTMTASSDVLQFNAASGNTPAEFEIASGSITVGSTSTAVTFEGNFGSGTNPGVLLQGGSLVSLDITVSSSMTVAGLGLTANGVEFEYQSETTSSSGIFEIATGTVTVGTSSDPVSFSGTFGGTDSGGNTLPGLAMSGSTLTGLDITVSSSMNVDDMSLSVNDLQFIYATSSIDSGIYTGDFLIQSGSVTFSTSAQDTVFAAAFGSGVNPGLVVRGESLVSLYATITSTISAQDLTINAANLIFQYEGSSSSFEIVTGSVSISSGAIQFASATFGASGAPGLSIENGVLTGLDITISSSMNVDGMTLSISDVEFIYNAVSGQTDGNFQIAAGGSVSLVTGPSDNTLSFDGTFGTTQNSQTLPGLSISDGQLQSFYIGVTSNISLGGSLTLTTTNLTFSYASATATFEIPSGSVSVVDTSGDFNFTGTFGSTLSNGTTVPGLIVSSGALTELNISVTSSLTAASLTMTVDNLDFYYNATGNQYEIDSGSLSFETSEDFTFSATFGLPDPSNSSETLPGLVIVNGVLTEFNAALTSNFTVAGLVITVTDMAMIYSASEYQMYGTVSVDTTDVSFTGTIGQPTASPPVEGLIIDSGSLKSLAITINSTVDVDSLDVTATNLAFNYESSPESFALYGTVTASISGVTLVGNLGDATDPGLSLVNGQLVEFNLGVTADFTLFGLTCNVQDLTFQYQSMSGNTDYVLYGGLSLSVSGNTLSATMGNDSNPGLIIQNNVVTQINMAITGSFEISGFGFAIVDAGCDYIASADEYLIFGTFTLTDVFTASVQLGTGSSNPGITIINGDFQLDNFAFSLDNVPIGAFTLNYVDISYASTDDVWSGAGQVTFPTGWSIAASLTFVNGNLDDISLTYNAGTSTGIAIPDTGMFVTEISASLENLDEPANIIVSGSIQAVFGKKISIGGTTCTIFAATGSFTADSQELVITGNYYEGAYESNGNWTGILGSGSASVDLDWAAGVYTASVSESLYDGTFVISASLAFDDSGDLGIIATASVNVPDAVPFIGGTQLGSMSFAFIYTASSNTGIVGAWINVNVYFTTITTGFEYSFSSGSSGSFSLIGAGGVNSIENSFNAISSSDSSTPPVYVYSYSATIASGSGSDGLSVQAIWPANSGTQTLLISGPNDNGTYYSLASPPPSSDQDQFLTSYTTATSQSVLTNGSSTNPSVALPAGTYTFEVQSTYEFPSTSDVTFTNQLYYQPPSVSITSVPSKALTFVPTMSGFAAGALALNTTITLYAQTSSSGYAGKEVGSFGYSVNSSGVLQSVPTIDLSSYSPGVPIYIYAIINDGTNTAVYSALSPAIIPVPNLVGQVLDQFGNPIAGLTIFLDLNNDGTDDVPNVSANGTSTLVADPSVSTNLNGDYYFNNLGSYMTTDIGYPTFRVTALMPSPSFTPITPINSVDTINSTSSTTTASSPTGSIIANFTVNRLASISGSIYSDLNQNGVYVSSDPALGGATVYLDTSGTGTYQSGDPTCVAGPSGTYGFYELTPTTYTSGIITSTTTGTTTTQNYVVTEPAAGTYSVPVTNDSQQLTGYTFGAISLATISGALTSQNTQESTAAPLSGTTLDISTPNLSASVPNYTSFSSSSSLKRIGSSVSSSGSLTMLGSSQSDTSTAAWYTTPVPLLGGFETNYQWSMTSTGATSGGFAFVIQNSGTSALGSSAYGYGGIEPSVAVIFDAVDNEILIESGGNTSSSSALSILTSQELGFTLASDTVYTTRIVFQPTNSSGLGTLSVYLSGDSSGGLTPLITASVNLASLLNLGTSSSAVVGFTAGTSDTGLAAAITSWSFNALNTQSTTTDSQGNYSFTGLMPKSNYTVSQVVPSGYIQSSPFDTQGVYSQLTLSSLGAVASSVVSGDFNGDGIPDAAYAISLDSGSPYEIAYAYGNGQGGFSAPVLVTIPVPAGAPTLATPSGGGSNAFDAFLAAGHFGNQSRDYIAYVATMATGGNVVVVYDILTNTVINLFEIESSGVAPTLGQYVAPGYAGTINNVAVGDLNNDGYDDLAVSTYGGVYTIVSLQDFQSSTSWTVNPATLAIPFGTPALLNANGTSGNTTGTAYNAGVAIGDFNQDGNLDLATVGVDYIPVVSSSGRSGTTDSYANMTVATTIQLADGTGNGVDYTPQSPLTFQLYSESNIDQYFSSSSSSPTFPIPFGMSASDINGDGIPDLVLNGYTDSLQPAVIALVQSAGNFSNAGTFLFPNGKSFNFNSTFGDNVSVPGSSVIAAQVIGIDLNGDGFNDIAAVDPNVGQMMLLTSSAEPLTTAQTQTVLALTGGALPQFVAADYSQDGYPDLIVPGQNDVTSQTAPVMILNGTLNVGTISYTPTNGQVLTGQNFSDINFTGSSNSTDIAVAGVASVTDPVGSAQPNTNFTIAGRVFLDRNLNLRYNAGETGLGGLRLYLDNNQSGQFDPESDPSTITNNQGYYAFTGLAPGKTYHIGIANLPVSDSMTEVTVSTPAASQTGIIDRYIGVIERWSIPQPVWTVDPLTPIAIDLAPLPFRESLGFKPFFQLVGSIPSGMTIAPYTGQILWTPPSTDAGSTLNVTVQIRNSTNPSALETQLSQFQIRVNALSPVAAYIRDVYGALLSRLPSPAELSQWSSKLQSGTSLLSFVSSISHTDERYAILTKNTYLTVLSRQPTASEYASALAMFQSGGNSDRLTRQLLTSPEFIQDHNGNLAYVNAVNQILTFTTGSPQLTAWEVAWLRMGRSRTKLVDSISTSQAATRAKATQLSSWYFGQPSSSNILSQWATALAKGTLNSDSLTTLILASQTYANGSSSRDVANIQAPQTDTSQQYNRLAHLQFGLTGSDASRSQLDYLEAELYDGQTWRHVASGIYNSQAAINARIQRQFQNLLLRRATSSELTKLTKTLPAPNQTEALQIQVLSGSEYRSQFPSTTRYVNSVYQVLTGATPSLKAALSWTNRLNRGLSRNQFVSRIASSSGGRTGQVQRLYQEYLGREPSATEVRNILHQHAKSQLQDRPIALQLLNSNEFRLQQRTAELLPVSQSVK